MADFGSENKESGKEFLTTTQLHLATIRALVSNGLIRSLGARKPSIGQIWGGKYLLARGLLPNEITDWEALSETDRQKAAHYGYWKHSFCRVEEMPNPTTNEPIMMAVAFCNFDYYEGTFGSTPFIVFEKGDRYAFRQLFYTLQSASNEIVLEPEEKTLIP
jgi:hypothetical protein